MATSPWLWHADCRNAGYTQAGAVVALADTLVPDDIFFKNPYAFVYDAKHSLPSRQNRWKRSHAWQEFIAVSPCCWGLSEITEASVDTQLEGLLGQLVTDVVVLRASQAWDLAQADRILVPVGGQGGHDYLLTRLLSSLSQKQKRQVKFLRVVSSHTSPEEFRRIARGLKRTARDNSGGDCQQQVIASDDVIGTIAEQAGEKGVIVLGVQQLRPKTKLFGDFTRRIARQSHSPIIISRRG